MADILLLEPAYKNKYPPIGLMKISYFHRYLCKDYVRFAKGKLPDAFNGKKWDRVYVTTLFTFEWAKTKEALEYARTVVKDPGQVYTGGILATLMPELIRENFPEIKINTGLLDKKGTLGLRGEECIDRLTLDYGILEDIADEYSYPAQDAYFTYMTRGCGMKCQFCAVQTLEPKYYPYISITETIKQVDKQFGPKKDLLLMDNNVLISPDFDKIVDEIISLGFGKGATYVNPKSGKKVQRFVDFNQGLDAYLLTPHKAKRLGELAIRPARIAFDHIEDKDAYVKAIKLCAENGITHMSNYLLYNGEEFSGKGHKYHADSPGDLYERMHISMDLQEELTESTGHNIGIFSFPMRYIPLEDLKRGYVGKNWNTKYLRALQRMLIPTQGKGVSSRSFFEADFGTSPEEFVMYLAMPEEHLSWRGHFVEREDELEADCLKRRQVWEENQKYIAEWQRLFEQLDDKKEDFINIIGDNIFTIEKFVTIDNPLHKKLFIHYFTIPTLLKVLNTDNEDARHFIIEYITNEFPTMFCRMARHVASSRIPYSLLEGGFLYIGQEFVKEILKNIDYSSQEPFVINNLIKIQIKTKTNIFNFELIRAFFLYAQLNALSSKDIEKAIKNITNLDERGLKKTLVKNFKVFSEKMVSQATEDEDGAEYIADQISQQLSDFSKQLSLFA